MSYLIDRSSVKLLR